MFRRRWVTLLITLFLVAACVPGSSPSPVVTGSPTQSAAAPTGSPSEPSATPTESPAETTPAPASPTAAPLDTPAPTTAETMIVRAYFLLGDQLGGDPALVPVLRTVPKSVATARAAMNALLAGPSAAEQGATPSISTTVPADTKLLGIEISGGLATVDLSGAFASGGGTFSMRGRLAQVTYTLTQFRTVERVSFRLDGEPVSVFSSEGIIIDRPVTRATYRDDFLPAIFVDRPAWGAGAPDPVRVEGLANVFEAQFRVALLDAGRTVLVDRQVSATCGTGCWGTFDVLLPYVVSDSQWGTLRAWDISEADGQDIDIREYPVYLQP